MGGGRQLPTRPRAREVSVEAGGLAAAAPRRPKNVARSRRTQACKAWAADGECDK
jgi:hypothetical protein